MSGFNVRRHLRPVNEIEKPENSTLVIAGATSDSYIISNKELFDFVLKGGRLIVVFSPNAKSFYFTEKKKQKEKEKKETAKDNSKQKALKCKKEKPECSIQSEEDKISLMRLKKAWGFELEKNRHGFIIETNVSPHEVSMKEHGFSEMPFYSPLNLELLHEDWVEHYSYKGKVVMAERRYGKGSVLLSVACYFISNESLREGPQLNLLRHAFMERENIFFDETHHGLKEKRNIVWLGKKYKLALFVLNLILLAAFLIWKSLFSISGYDTAEELGEGKIKSTFNNTSGLVNLLKRGVNSKGLVAACFKEWEKTIKYRHILQNKGDDIRKSSELSDSPKDQVGIYNKIYKTILKMKARGK
jgi:hypothetical protein